MPPPMMTTCAWDGMLDTRAALSVLGDGVPQNGTHMIDVRPARYESRCENRHIARSLDVQSSVEEPCLQFDATHAGGLAGLYFDAREQPEAAYIGNCGQVLQAVHGVEEMLRQVLGLFEQLLFLVDLKCREPGCTGCRMRRVRIAMEELGQSRRGSFQDGAINTVTHGDRTHWLRAIGERLGHGDDVRRDAEGVGGEGTPGPAEAGN